MAVNTVLKLVRVEPFGFITLSQRWLLRPSMLPPGGIGYTYVAVCSIEWKDSNRVIEPLGLDTSTRKWIFYPPAPCKYFTDAYMPQLTHLTATVRFGRLENQTRHIIDLKEPISFDYEFITPPVPNK